jgi:hypothetical protein
MTWNNGTGFDLGNGTLAPIESWIVENEPAGLIRTARNLTYILFYNASHMVPYNQPRRSRVMLHQFIKLNFNALINSTTSDNIEVTNQITYRVSKRALFIALIIIITILICVGFIWLFVYKWRKSRIFTLHSIRRVFQPRTHGIERQQLRLYSIIQDSNEDFCIPDDETLV